MSEMLLSHLIFIHFKIKLSEETTTMSQEKKSYWQTNIYCRFKLSIIVNNMLFIFFTSSVRGNRNDISVYSPYIVLCYPLLGS